MDMYPAEVAEKYFLSISHYWKATVVALIPSSTSRTVFVKALKTLLTNQGTLVVRTNSDMDWGMFVGNVQLSLLFGATYLYYLKLTTSVLHVSSFCQLRSYAVLWVLMFLITEYVRTA